MAEDTIQNLQQKLQLVEQMKQAVSELSEMEQLMALNSFRVLQNLQQQNSARDELIEKLTKQKEEGDKQFTAESEQRLQSLQSIDAFYEKNQQRIDTAVAENKRYYQELSKMTAVHTQDAEKRYDAMSRNIGKKQKMSRKSADLTTQDLFSAGVGAFGAFESTIGGIVSNQTLALTQLASEFGLKVGKTFTDLRAEALDMPRALDTGLRGIARTQGFFSESMRDTFVLALDPQQALREGIEFMEAPLAGVGFTAETTKGALAALLQNVSMFRPAFMEADPATAIFTSNLVQGLEKIGVGFDTSTSALDNFNRVFRKSPVQAGKSVKRLTKIAESLGKSAGQVVTDFNDALPELAQFGERAIDVFADLQAQSVATGLSLGDLSDFAAGLDTFDGAARAAQGLNAVLGGTFVSMTDLVHADPSEKINILRDALDRAGVSFEDTDRRMKQVIANQLGRSVADTARLLNGADEFEELSSSIDTTAMSQEEFKQKIQSTMSQSELLMKNMSAMGGGFDKFVDRMRGAAVEGSNIMIEALGGALEVTKDIEVALFATLGGLSAAESVLGLGVGAAGLGLGRILGTGATQAVQRTAAGAGAAALVATGVGTGGPTSPGGAMPAAQVQAGGDKIQELIDTIKAAGTVPIEIKVEGDAGGGNLDVWNRKFDKSFGDVGTK